MVAARRSVRRWAGRPEGSGGLRCVTLGACWPAARIAECNLNGRTSCRRCGHQNEDEFHTWWSCPCWQGPDQHRASRDSQHLLAEAGREHEAWPIFWLRGLPPRSWVEEVIRPNEVGDEVEVFGWGCLREPGVYPLPSDALLAVDASGGHHTSDPRLRRVTFGLVVLSGDGAVLGGMAGQAPGAQTVNRGELFGTVLALELTAGPTTIITDSAFVVNSFSVDVFE